jgi:WD40 repeat protein
MPASISSTRDARKKWRYATETDFHSIHPTNPSSATNKRILSYGSEERFLPFDYPDDKAFWTFSVNSDDTLFALVDNANIDVYNLDTGTKTVLRGHTARVRELGFSPTDPNLLVSWSEAENTLDLEQSHNEIIIWDIRDVPISFSSNHPVGEAGVQAVIAALGDDLTLSTDEMNEIRSLLTTTIDRFAARSRILPSSRLSGSLHPQFQSSLFSHSGDYLVYRNGSHNLHLRHIANGTTTVLTGHTAGIMGTSFSPDDKLIASAGWDGSVRVHEVTGQEVWKFETGNQNWAVAFHPNGRYVAGTDGKGILRVWNLETGEQSAKHDSGPAWCRAIDWSNDGDYLIAGSEFAGVLRLFRFFEMKSLIELDQERKLSTKRCHPRVSWFLRVQTAKFLAQPENKDGQKSMKLVSSVMADEGIEIFDFVTGMGWRFVPPYNEDGSAITTAVNGDDAFRGHVWRKDRGEFGVVAEDGIRFWRLD